MYVRIYDLAKELKQDTKRLIEELRREGVDVNVPSQAIAKEIADKIRRRYFSRAKYTPGRGITLIKSGGKDIEKTPVKTKKRSSKIVATVKCEFWTPE